ILFGIPEGKDALGSEAYAERGVVQQAIETIKEKFPDLLVITDVCLCEYTDHGHCGIIKDGDVDNDETLELLAREALSHAQAGRGAVGPAPPSGRPPRRRRARRGRPPPRGWRGAWPPSARRWTTTATRTSR